MIEVTVHIVDKEIDLLVPAEVTFARLAELIGAGFAAHGTTLPEHFSLKLGDKALAVSGYDIVSSFGVGNGDRLHIEFLD